MLARFIFLLWLTLGTALAQFGGPATVRAKLISSQEGITAGTPFLLAVELDHDDHWHTYWTNPGDTGQATKIAWNLPEGFEAGPVQFPVPKQVIDFDIPALAYEGKTLLLVQIRPPAEISGETITLGAKIDWLACNPETCIPGNAEVTLTLPVKTAEANGRGAEADRIEEAQNLLPLPMPDHAFYVSEKEGKVVLTGELLDGILPEEGTAGFTFHPDRQVLKLGGPLEIERNGLEIILRGEKSEFAPDSLPGEVGVLILKPDGGALHAGGEILEGEGPSSPEVAPAPAGATSGIALAMTDEARAAIEEMKSWGSVPYSKVNTSGEISSAPEEAKGFVGMAFFAFLGGMILNLMPCVFPVLAIKIMGFVKQAGEDKKEIRKHGLVFALGVLASLWTLVAVMLILKRVLGEQIGWGFQLQNPYFVLGMIVLLFLFGLSLSGVFEFGTSMTGVGGDLTRKQGVSGSFFSGILAILLATPCTGPFMAPAIAFAFREPAIITFLIFTALGLGLALPYVILSFAPGLIQKLPKPGAWMETFKQLMAFLLYGTAAWLAMVFGGITGIDGITRLLYGAVLGALGVWAWGRFGSPIRKPATRVIAGIAALALVGTFFWLGSQGAKQRPLVNNSTTTEKFGITWERLSAGTLPDIIQNRKKGRTVFLDFTADW